MRIFGLVIALCGLLGACASPEEEARYVAVQEREFPLPVQACIDHVTGQPVQTESLIAAGFLKTEQTYRREFTDLDTALSARGAIDLTLAEDCEFFIPVHVILPGVLYQRMKAELLSRGFEEKAMTLDRGLIPLERIVFTNGETTVLMSSGTTSTILLGMVTRLIAEKV
ncbi:MAG: hypothetical protein AAF674_10145 [Pseudomonadota bacterium]